MQCYVTSRNIHSIYKVHQFIQYFKFKIICRKLALHWPALLKELTKTATRVYIVNNGQVKLFITVHKNWQK